MKNVSLLPSLVVLLALSACSDEQVLVQCDAPHTIELVTESVNNALLVQSGGDDSVSFTYALSDITTLETNSETGALVCSAELAVTIKDEQMDDTLTTGITYRVEQGAEQKQLIVKVFENI